MDCIESFFTTLDLCILDKTDKCSLAKASTCNGIQVEEKRREQCAQGRSFLYIDMRLGYMARTGRPHREMSH